jgi:hypothetical protein
MSLESLDERSRDHVWAAWTAVETALDPVPEADFPALADPALRHHLAFLGRRAGRVLVEGPRGRWLTAYDDAVVSELAHEGLGVLSPEDRAVLALVLINTVCIHRAQTGISGGGWDAPGVPAAELEQYRPQYRSVIRAALRRLDARGLIDRSPAGGVIPGPALRRLTGAQSQTLWEDLVMAADRSGPLGTSIRSRRVVSSAQGAQP